MRPSRPALALVVGGQFSTQFGAALAATLFDRLGAGGAVALRLGVSALVLLAVCRPGLRGRGPGVLRTALVFGVALGAMNITFYEAIARIPLGAAVTLEVLGPLTLSVVASRGPLRWVWAGLALAGVALLGRADLGVLDPLGVAFALAAGVFWAGYIVLGQRVGRAFDRLDGLALAMGVGAVLALPVGIASAGTALLDPVSLGLGAAVALLSSLLPYSLEQLALRRVPAGVFAVVMSLSPAVAALAGAVVLGQGLTPLTGVAIALVVAANAGAVGTAARIGRLERAQPPPGTAGQPPGTY